MATITQKREVKDFTQVALHGQGDILLEQTADPTTSESLVIEADEAILPRLSSQVRNGRLILSWDLAWWEWFTWWIDWLTIPNKKVHYHITMKQIEGVTISGSGSVTASHIQSEQSRWKVSGSAKMHLDNLQSTTLHTIISGSGMVELSGSAQHHDIHISGSGKIAASEMQTQETTITISGSGQARVNAAQTLEVRISGSGDVRYVGQPKVSQHISGSGRVRQE
jgi:hypothetical protein